MKHSKTYSCFCESIDDKFAYLSLIDIEGEETEFVLSINKLEEAGFHKFDYFNMTVTDNDVTLLPIDTSDEVIEEFDEILKSLKENKYEI